MSPSSRRTLWILAGSLAALLLGGLLWWILRPAPTPPSVPAVEGVTLDARQQPGPRTYNELEQIGAGHVALVPYIFQQDAETPAFGANYGSGWATENDDGIRQIAQALHARDIELVLKPQLWLRDDSKGWLQSIDFAEGTKWKRWKTGYRKHILHYARMAERLEADLFCIGAETDALAARHPAFWRDLIEEIRTIYDGELTYAANFGTFYRIPFWSSLDRIGIQAYFPLAVSSNPSLGALQRRWAVHKRLIEREVRKHNRPVLFTEIGYRSAPNAAREPWAWPKDGAHKTVRADSALQARLYRAFFRSVWQEPWFSGALLWKWYRSEEARYPERAVGFTPQGKPASDVIQRWYVEKPPPGAAPDY